MPATRPRPPATTVAAVQDLAVCYAATRRHLDGLPIRIASHQPTGALVVTWTDSAGQPRLGGEQLWVHPTNGRWAATTPPLGGPAAIIGLRRDTDQR